MGICWMRQTDYLFLKLFLQSIYLQKKSEYAGIPSGRPPRFALKTEKLIRSEKSDNLVRLAQTGQIINHMMEFSRFARFGQQGGVFRIVPNAHSLNYWLRFD